MINKKYYRNIHEIMRQKNIDLPRPNPRIISITVPVWSDLNVKSN